MDEGNHGMQYNWDFKKALNKVSQWVVKLEEGAIGGNILAGTENKKQRVGCFQIGRLRL